MKTQEYLEFKQSLVTLVKTALRSLRKNKNQLEILELQKKEQFINRVRDVFEKQYENILEHWNNEYVKLKFEDGKIFNSNFMYEYFYIKDFNEDGIQQLVDIMPMVFGLVSIRVKGIEMVKNEWALNLINQIIDRQHCYESEAVGSLFQRYGGKLFSSLPAIWRDCFITGEYGSMYEIAPKKTHCVRHFDEDLPEWRSTRMKHPFIELHCNEKYDYNVDRDEGEIHCKYKKITLILKYNQNNFVHKYKDNVRYFNEIEIKIG